MAPEPVEHAGIRAGKQARFQGCDTTPFEWGPRHLRGVGWFGDEKENIDRARGGFSPHGIEPAADPDGQPNFLEAFTGRSRFRLLTRLDLAAGKLMEPGSVDGGDAPPADEHTTVGHDDSHGNLGPHHAARPRHGECHSAGF